MKELCFLFLLIHSGTLCGQQIYTFKEAREHVPTDLLKQYAWQPGESDGSFINLSKPSWPHKPGPALDSLYIKGIILPLKALFPGPKAPYLFYQVSAYVNETGGLDYLLYHIHSSELSQDTIASRFKTGLPPLLAGYTWPAENKKMHYSLNGTIGVPPRKAVSDSVTLTTVEELDTYRDTLAIRKLNLSGLDLTEIPVSVYRFPRLEELTLSGNPLKVLSLDVRKLPRLHTLNAQKSDLTDLHLTRNKSLRVVNIQGNQLSAVPADLRKSRRLLSLWLGHNPTLMLTGTSFKGLRRLKDLNLYNCQMKDLPAGVRKLKRLEVIDLYYNQLSEVPAGLTRLKKLTHLAISYNQIVSLPPELKRLKRLEYLYAHHNRISRLPAGTASLKKLRILDIGYNWFSVFPTPVLGLQSLEELDISANNFSAFPKELTHMGGVQKIYLRGNPFLENQHPEQYSADLESIRQKSTEVFH